MSLKKIKIINIIFLFALSFLWHFIYDWIPINLTAIFFPVNESIWEHMKIIYGVLIVGSVLQKFLCHKFNIEIHNTYIEMMVKPIIGIIIYLAIFIPVYNAFGESMVFAIFLMLVTYIIVEMLGMKILKAEELNIKIMPIIIIILGFVLFGLLTFYPPHNGLFFDEVSYGYGIIKK